MPAEPNSRDSGSLPTEETPRKRPVRMLSDPVLRILIAATAISALGRGVFLTLTILYFTFVVGLSTVEVAIILTVASAVGVAASLLGGTLADRVSGRRLLLWFLAVEGIALACYTVASSFVPALVIACIVMAGNRGANTARSAIIGRAFTGPARVGARAALRTIQNVGVAIGSAAASIPLLFGTSNAYHLTIIIAAAATLASTLVIMRLPRRVDAARLMSEKRAPLGGRSAWRDPRYAALTTLSALFGIQFGLAEIGLPLWIMHETSAPLVTVSIIIMINTVLVVALQIPFSRGTHDIRRAGNAVAIAGVSMAVACGIYSVTAGVPPVAAIVLLTLGMVAHTIAEILSSAGTWGLSYELADPRRIGEYQGLFAMAFSMGSMVTPAIVTITVIENGTAGWAALAALFLGSALAIAAIARRAAPRSSAGTSRRGRRSFRSRPMSTGAVPT